MPQKRISKLHCQVSLTCHTKRISKLHCQVSLTCHTKRISKLHCQVSLTCHTKRLSKLHCQVSLTCHTKRISKLHCQVSLTCHTKRISKLHCHWRIYFIYHLIKLTLCRFRHERNLQVVSSLFALGPHYVDVLSLVSVYCQHTLPTENACSIL